MLFTWFLGYSEVFAIGILRRIYIERLTQVYNLNLKRLGLFQPRYCLKHLKRVLKRTHLAKIRLIELVLFTTDYSMIFAELAAANCQVKDIEGQTNLPQELKSILVCLYLWMNVNETRFYFEWASSYDVFIALATKTISVYYKISYLLRSSHMGGKKRPPKFKHIFNSLTYQLIKAFTIQE